MRRQPKPLARSPPRSASASSTSRILPSRRRSPLLWLSTVPPTNGLVAIMFGTRHLGLLGGIVFLSHQVGSFLGVWMGGYLYDHFGTYDPVWWLGVALGLIAAVVHWPIEEKGVTRPAVA